MANELVAQKLILTTDEMRLLRNFVRKAFADRLDNEQRKLLVESLTECEGASERPQYGPLADYRLHVSLLADSVRDSFAKSLGTALKDFCGKGR